MIILDTNVISESLKPEPSPMVQAWLDRQVVETLFLTTTTLSELLLGVELLPHGKRRQGLAAAVGEIVERLFRGRTLSFDQRAATTYATIVFRARTRGCPISVPDAQIAAVAKRYGFQVATRNTAPFQAAGVSGINPWLA
jgi:predicted nucleic acid-binding protein